MISAQDLIEKTLAKADFDDCIVLVEDSTQANLRWANSTLTTNGMITERSVTILAFVAVGGRMAVGAATRNSVEATDIEAVLAEAKSAALAAGPASDAAELLKDKAIGDWQAAHQPTGPEVFKQFAPDLGDMFGKAVADDIELFGYAEHTVKTSWLGSKGGLRLRYDQPQGRVEMTGKSHGRTRSTWEGRATRDFTNINVSEIDEAVRRKLGWQANQIQLPAGRYETVMPAEVFADILLYGLFMSDARSAHEGRSAYSKPGGGTRIGEKLASVGLNIYTDSSYKGIECSPYIQTAASSSHSSVFDNGQPTGRVQWMEDGVLTGLVQTRESAVLTGQPFTPMGDNFIVDANEGAGTLQDLIRNTNDGLLVNTFWYIRLVNPASLLLTGLTRDGVYQVKNGEVVAAVNNFRWNESPLEMMSRILQVSKSEVMQNREWNDFVHRTAFPAVRVADFNMSTVSQAS